MRLGIRDPLLTAAGAGELIGDGLLWLSDHRVLQVLLLDSLHLLLEFRTGQLGVGHGSKALWRNFSGSDTFSERRVLLVLEVEEDRPDLGFVGGICCFADVVEGLFGGYGFGEGELGC